MDAKFGEYQIEWDDQKAASNILKHGIRFELAALVFGDAHCVYFYDELHSSLDEDRYIALGYVGDVLLVVYTERLDAIRIISARRATNRERKLYYVNRKA